MQRDECFLPRRVVRQRFADENRIAETSRWSRSGECGQPAQFIAGLLQSFAQDKLAIQTHVDFQTKMFPFPRFTVACATRHQ